MLLCGLQNGSDLLDREPKGFQFGVYGFKTKRFLNSVSIVSRTSVFELQWCSRSKAPPFSRIDPLVIDVVQ